MPRVSRTVWLVGVAMLMFAGGVVVFIRSTDLDEHILAATAMLGAIAIVVTNVNGDTHE